MKTYFCIVFLFVEFGRNLKKKLGHIVASLLLVFFPITAVDLHFSIFQCKHKGTFHILFFDKTYREDCCAVDVDNDSNNEFTTQRTCCNNQNQFECSLDNIEPKTSLSNKLVNPIYSDIEGYRNGDCSHQKQSNVNNHNVLWVRISFSCCYEKHFKLSLPNTIIPSEYSKKIVFPLEKQVYNHLQYSLDVLNSNKPNYKSTNYPIKKPTFHIISYILYLSSKKDSDDVPLFPLC